MIQFDLNTVFWMVISLVGSSIASILISWFFSKRYTLVADIVTVSSDVSKYSEEEKVIIEKGFTAYDTYIVLENHSNQALEMKDFAPKNMPRILINNGKLQSRELPYYVLENPNPFAMYNNVRLSYDGDATLNISFDQLKKGQNIEIIVHSLIKDDSSSNIKLAIAATLKNGNFICKKQIRNRDLIVQTILIYLFLPILMALPMLNGSIRIMIMILLVIWGPIFGKIVNGLGNYRSLNKIVKKSSAKHKKAKVR